MKPRVVSTLSALQCLLWSVPFAALACHAPAGERAAASVRDPAGVALTTIAMAVEDVPEWDLRPTGLAIPRAQDEDSPEFMEVSDAQWLSDGRILVVDRGARVMYVFQSDGTLRDSLGRVGRGPGEFSQITAVSVTLEDSIFVHDRVRRTLQVFHPDAGLIRTVSLTSSADSGAFPSEFRRLGPDRLVRLSYRPGPVTSQPAAGQWVRWPDTEVLALVNEAGDLLAHRVEFDGSYSALGQVGDLRVPLANRPFVFVGAHIVAYGSGQAFDITVADPGTLAPRMRVSWPSLREPIEAAEIARLAARRLGRSRSERTRELVATQFSRRLLPEFRPALGGVLIDSNRRIWAGRFEAAIDYPNEALWYVLDARGTPLGRVPLPPKSHLTAVLGDSVLLVQRDSLDSWSVRAYRVLR